MLHVPQDMMELPPQHKFNVRLVGIGQLLQDAPLKVNYDSVSLCKTIYYIPIYDTSFELTFSGYLIPYHYFLIPYHYPLKQGLPWLTVLRQGYTNYISRMESEMEKMMT